MTSVLPENWDMNDPIWVEMILRRPKRTDDLGPVLGLDEERAADLAFHLRRNNRVDPDGVTILYDHPVPTATGLVRLGLAEAAERFNTAVDQLDALLGEIPGMAHAWEVRKGGAHHFAFEVITGPEAPIRSWNSYSGRGGTAATTVILPELWPDAFAAPAAAIAARAPAELWAGLSVVISTETAGNPAAQELIGEMLAAGADVRHHPRLPSWFWVSDSTYAAIPGTWGLAWPESVLAFTHPVVGAALRDLAGRLWREASPVRRDVRTWDPLLELLLAGSQIEAASRALGISVRTGRRRISDAMDFYGVSNLFSLGAAWSREQDGRRRR